MLRNQLPTRVKQKIRNYKTRIACMTLHMEMVYTSVSINTEIIIITLNFLLSYSTVKESQPPSVFCKYNLQPSYSTSPKWLPLPSLPIGKLCSFCKVRIALPSSSSYSKLSWNHSMLRTKETHNKQLAS